MSKIDTEELASLSKRLSEASKQLANAITFDSPTLSEQEANGFHNSAVCTKASLAMYEEVQNLRTQLAEANARADRAASIADLALAINREWKCEPGKSAAHEWRLWADRKRKMEDKLKELLKPASNEAPVTK